jgi:hypothetical protein
MHYSVLCIVRVPENGRRDIESVRSLVDEIMARHEGSLWDWYQIGGRWSGAFDGYDPDQDPRHVETCELCLGTGMRRDDVGNDLRKEDPTYTCNGCQGKGKRPVWPTQRQNHDGDVIGVELLTASLYERHFYAVVCTGYNQAFSSEEYVPWSELVGERFQEKALPPLAWIQKEFAGCLAVIVDCHN